MVKTKPVPEFAPDAIQPHPLQAQILRALFDEPGVRIVVVGTGRQVGKTETGQMAVMEGVARAKSYFKVDYGAPTYILATEVYTRMKGKLKPFIHKAHDSTLTLELLPVGRNRDGGRVKFRSLENHDNIRGDNSDLWIVDEMCDVVKAAWEATILPMLLARSGKALVLGTPKRVGKGFMWARQEWNKGLDRAAYPTHRCFAAPSKANPVNTEENIAILSANMTEDVYREEILGEWLDDSGAVFVRLDEAFSLPFVEVVAGRRWVGEGTSFNPRHRYIVGFDYAPHEDFNVFSVWDLTNKSQVEVQRVRGEYFEDVLASLHDLRERWGRAVIYADGNGPGEVIMMRLAKRYGDGAVDRKWSSNAIKQNDITAARLLFERAEWKFLRMEWQRAEFQNYTRERMPGGGYKYGAPPGGFDDSVAAACMVAERVKTEWRPIEDAKTTPLLEVKNGEVLLTSEWFKEQEARERKNKRKWPWTGLWG